MGDDSRKKIFEKKDINEQTRYLADFSSWMMLELDMENSRARRRMAARTRDVPDNIAVSKGEQGRELHRRMAAFKRKLDLEQDRYPLGCIFSKFKLNSFERFVFSVVSAYAMFDKGQLPNFDVRTLASLYCKSNIKRLNAEMYFKGRCRLERLLLIMVQPQASGMQVFEREVLIRPDAYEAVMGQNDIQAYEPEDGASTLSRKKRPGAVGEKSLGELVKPAVNMSRVVMPTGTREQMEKALAQASNGDRIFHDWGLGRQVTKGTGVTILLSGPPGTGKTLAAEAFSEELGREMLLVRGSDLVSPWHGEDEINIAGVFMRASKEGAVLVFDEADSFFYARHGVARSTDVMSNSKVNVILGMLESHGLPVILTTNRAAALDPALERRISTKVVFDPPAAAERRKIWQLHLPRKMPRAKDVDVKALAERYPLTGGQIKNAVVTAARSSIYIASKDGGEPEVAMGDLVEACELELEGGRVFGTSERRVGF